MKLCLYFKQYFERATYDWLHNFCGEWEGLSLINWFNHTSWVTAVTPTDRPKSVRNSCVIKVFGGVFMLSRCFLDCSVGVGVFVTGLSQISSFFSYEGQFGIWNIIFRVKMARIKYSLNCKYRMFCDFPQQWPSLSSNRYLYQRQRLIGHFASNQIYLTM